jgi:hypothetical protein
MAPQDRRRLFLLHSLYWLTGRGAVFFFVFSLLVFALYLLGNFQEFLDSSQLILLGLLRIGLLSQLLTALAYFVMLFLLGRQRRYPGRLVLCVLSAAFSAALLLAVGFLSAWLRM